MPGRHSGSSGLGGSGGMRGGGFGGGFRGSPGWGGGWRGGDDWRWRGGGGWWRWRGPGPLGWGWIMPWTWFGFGGLGCLPLLFVGIVAFFVVMGMGLNSWLGNAGYWGNLNGSDQNYTGGANLANESPAIQTQTAQDIAELHTAFDNRIAAWNTQVANNQNLSIPPADAGLTQDNNTQAVLYGKCGSALYIYVIENTKPDTGPANGEGYVYTAASSPGACHPPQWTVYDSESVGGGWYFVTLESAN
jgi:hypothetical protein